MISQRVIPDASIAGAAILSEVDLIATNMLLAPGQEVRFAFAVKKQVARIRMLDGA